MGQLRATWCMHSFTLDSREHQHLGCSASKRALPHRISFRTLAMYSAHCKGAFWQFKQREKPQDCRENKWLISPSQRLNFSWRWSWPETTPSCSQGTSVLTVLPLGKWGLVMGLLTLPQHLPCPRRPFSTSWHKQKRMGLYKKSSFDPDSHQLYLHQCCLPASYDDSESPGNGHVPDITMLSASSDQHWRTKGGVGREKGPARQDERTWPRFLMGGTGGGKRKQEYPLLSLFNHINSA